MGDWNVKIGDNAVEGISGTHGLGCKHEAGERMIELCEANQLIVTNTWYKQRRRILYTWTSPDGLYRNQIDYLLIQRRWRSMVKSAKTMPGADCGTDGESKEELLQLVTSVKEKTVQAGLYLNLKQTKVISTEEIEEFELDGEKVEIVRNGVFLGAKIEDSGPVKEKF